MQDSYQHSITQAKQYASEAFSRLEKEGLPATPDLFELFYSYYSNNNSEVVRSIDIMVSQNFELTFDRCVELHRRLLNSDRSRAALEKAENIVGNTLADVDSMVTEVKTSNEDFSGSLNQINKDVSDAVEPDALKTLLADMMSETQKMMSENQALEKKLEKSATTMKDLKQEMQEVREEAYTDALTQIPNRKKFDLEIVRLVSEARDKGEPLSVIFMDIDHFKSFNDTYGHQIGDQVLRLVAKCLTDSLKGQDFACRYGGEEFVVLLPETDIEGAIKIANILRETIKTKEIRNRATGETLTKITISGGVALLGGEEEPKEWMERADRALYKAKRKGRDRVESAE